MSHYDTSVPKVIAENPKLLKYRRRILNPRRLEPTQGVRTIKVAGKLGMVGAVFYMVLMADWGEGEHCFSGVRRFYDEKKREFFTLSEEDERELRSKGKIVPPAINPADQTPSSPKGIGPFIRSGTSG
ncbi:uncharacterized protein SPPG_01753 [Spizellomyces punctatus DAOM BR117]|uniref:Uncharacterized protein n=1 Tax=Spizellomyces punctatus (strain DAOM BR117) TaxID=645134 RepID=A0A0L0HNP4_SPIPD|nr:uncharacterized protein SPPG_01753 [Spizellomyces punctatus DAOM BR117]KND02668.1 hypothetical protein SPPG_01753 [Spizellomyces punctatus DAOM BR117]|eukprot:XP_016610707.1 hypothetical protein SPPG_01753 [Spizellomyces punctatus DAOM BR117]